MTVEPQENRLVPRREESTAVLVFACFYEAFRAATWDDDFERLGLNEEWWPQD